MIPSRASVDVLSLQSNTSQSSTPSPEPFTTTAYYSHCANISSCDECLNAMDTHNLPCSWIEYTSNSNYTSKCITRDQCDNDDVECCTSFRCCNCLSQSRCIQCGSQGLNASCLWDASHRQCFTPNHTCPEDAQCLDNPSLLQCEYSANAACTFYFSTTSFWTLGYAGMLIFFVCLPCCLYHKCGIDWDSEFSLMSIYNQNANHNNYADQLRLQNDGHVFKGGAQITGRCMYGSFLCIGFLFACLAIFGTILSISCLDEEY